MTAILELWNRTSGCYILNTQGVPTFRSLKLASQFSKRYEQAEWIGGWVGMRLRGYWRSSPTNWPGIIVIANPFAKTSAAAWPVRKWSRNRGLLRPVNGKWNTRSGN